MIANSRIILTVLLLSAPLTRAGEIELPATVSVISGIAEVRDGDGINFGKIDVRMQGIAAPEYWKDRQTWGKESRQNLVDLAWGEFVVCHLDGSTAGSRPVGVCYLNNVDLGLLQVLSGFARDCPRFSNGRYEEAELIARRKFDLSEIYQLPQYCFEK